MDPKEVKLLVAFMSNLQDDLNEIVDKLEALDKQMSGETSITITSSDDLAKLTFDIGSDVKFTNFRSGHEYHHTFSAGDLLAVGRFLVATYGGGK